MNQPKYVLQFRPDLMLGRPYIIREYAIVEHGQVAERWHSSHRDFEYALEVLASLTTEPVILAFTKETIFD